MPRFNGVPVESKPRFSGSPVASRTPKEINLDPTAGMSELDKFSAGARKAVSDSGLGAQQAFYEMGNDPLNLGVRTDIFQNKLAKVNAEIESSRRLDAPLMNTGSGKFGNFAGNVAMGTLAATIPGINTYGGSAALGGLMGAAQPTVEGESRLLNTAIGAGGGAAGKYIGDKISDGVQIFNAQAQKALAARQAQSAVRDASLEAGQQAGYAVAPSMVNPSLLNVSLEGIAGKAGIGQGVSLKNQSVTNRLARQALGMADDAPLTEESLKAVRTEAGKAYQVIKEFPGRFSVDNQFSDDILKLGSDFSEAAAEFPELAKNEAVEALQRSLSKPDIGPKAAVELVKKLRFDASKNLKSFDDPAKSALGQAQRGAADALDDLIERNLTATNPGAAQAYKDARTLIAKSYDVESALNEADGNISAKVLAKAYEKGKPMTGELETIARFGSAFPTQSQNTSKLSSVLGGTPLDMALAGSAAYGSEDPRLLGLALIRPGLRAGITSKLGQAILAKPKGLPFKNQALGILQEPLLQQAIRSGIPAGLLSQ